VTDTGQISDNTEASRLELTLDGQLAELQYRIRGKRFVIIHTGVPAALEGRGLGGALVRAAVDRAVRDDLTLVPACPFARNWLERHPDVAASVVIDWHSGT
jgi:predicted GNAT family acetyltransferase